MERPITVSLDDNPVRFTPDGRMSVLDAIKALTLSDCPVGIWEDLKKGHPEILEHCGNHRFHKEGSLPVVDSEGWDRIWVLLMDYMLDPERSWLGLQGK